MMQVSDIERRVQRIKDCAGDDEAAHGMEDDLHQQVLKAIADGKCSNAALCAAAALKTQEIKFSRWCA